MEESPDMARVLLVEDEPLARWVGRKSLESLGCFVTEADSVLRAEEQLKAARFDVIVCDHRLPDGLGIELIRRLRGQGRQEQIIYLTAETEEITAPQVKALGLNALLAKPLNVDELRKAMADCLAAGTDLELARAGGVLAEAELRAGDLWPNQVVGRFDLVDVPQAPGAAFFEELAGRARRAGWLALNMAGVGTLGDEAIDGMLKTAEVCRSAGGRLCLVGLSAEEVARMKGRKLDREMDLVAGTHELVAQSRRLSSACERTALLDSIVERNRGPKT